MPRRLFKLNTRNIGWHGNALLVKRHVGVIDVAAIDLPTLEPRGAVMAELLIGDRPVRVIGMHLDLSRPVAAAADARDPRRHRRAAAEDADRADGRHQRMARRGRLPPGSAAATGSPRPAPASTPAARSPRSTGSSSTPTSRSRPPESTPAPRRARRVGPFARLGAAGALALAAGHLPLPPALDRRADAHRLAIFGDRAAREVEALGLQQIDQRVVAQNVCLRRRSTCRSRP